MYRESSSGFSGKYMVQVKVHPPDAASTLLPNNYTEYNIFCNIIYISYCIIGYNVHKSSVVSSRQTSIGLHLCFVAEAQRPFVWFFTSVHYLFILV